MAQAQVARVRAVAALVVVPVSDCHQEAGSRVEADAEAPDVTLGSLASNSGADGGEVVRDLEEKQRLMGRGVRSVSYCIYSPPRL